MFRLVVFCFCASAVWAFPSSTNHSKVSPFKLSSPRIVNGQRAQEGQFPWQAALFLSNNDGNWFCGGSIIDPEWILTAGHCIDGAQSARVLTGSLEPTQGDLSLSSEFVLHEDYDGEQLANDIGLIKLEKPLTFGANTGSVGLSEIELGDNFQVTVSGWGLTSDNDDVISDWLNFVDLITISNRKCEEFYGEGTIRPETLCAASPTEEVRSTCSGDSGGPMVDHEFAREALIAIVSWVSSEGCESGAPSGYTRISPYITWIWKQIGHRP